MNSLFGIPLATLTVVLAVAFAAAVGAVGALALRNRVFFKLGFRNIGRRRSRTVLIVLGLMLGTAIIAAALNTGDTMSHTIRSTVLTSLGNIDEVVSPAGTETTAGAFEAPNNVAYFDEAAFDDVRAALDGSELVDGVAPAIMEFVAVQDQTSRQNEPRVWLFASDPEHMAGFGDIKMTEGQTVSLGDLVQGEVYLNRDAADELDAAPGDRLAVFAAGRFRDLNVKAVVDYDGTGFDGPAMLMPLDAAQEVLDRPGQIEHILVSNAGGALSGAKHSDDVTALLKPVLDDLGLEAQATKQDALELADQVGSIFMSFFVTFGTFSILAGVLLIFLIFVMLAAERKTEMGIARAVGTQRNNLVQMFLFEGAAYDLVAAGFGALLGVAVAFGMVFIMSRAMVGFGVDIKHDLRPSSLVIAYTMGVLLTLLVVTVSAWRVSVLNIVTAIRDLPEPTRRGRRRSLWALGLFAIALGALLTVAGLNVEHVTPFNLGVSLVIVGFVPLLRGLGVPDRPAYTLPGLTLVVWWLLPFDALDALLGDLDADFSIFVLSGLMVVIGGTWTVMYNSDLALRALMAVFGRLRWLAPVLKTAISYPLTNRFRTGMTLAMFTLVVYTLVVMATTTNAFTDAFNDENAFGGGFDIRASTVPANAIEDMGAALQDAPGVNAGEFEAVANQSFVALDARQAGGEERAFEPYVVRGLDDAFLADNTYEFATMATGYESAPQVWQALADNPSLAVVDPLPVPRRTTWGFTGGGPDFKIEGFFIEDETFNRVPIELRDAQTGQVIPLKIIGVLKDTSPPFMIGVSTSQRALTEALGDRAPLTVHFFRLRDGVDTDATANALESAFLMNGMEADVLKDELEESVGTSMTFTYVLQGFMGLGLVVGVAALGVISARSVVERRQQIGVLRSIGFQREMVQLSFLLESSFVALVGILVGTFLGLVTAFNVIRDASQEASWDNISFAVPWANLLVIFLIVYAAALLTTYVPARQASRVYPAEALRYE